MGRNGKRRNGVSCRDMPSWNIHTAHVERLLAEHEAGELGICDVDAFLFGNYVPDIYLGYMVPNTTYRIDYCLTHVARPNMIPAPDADSFWDDSVWRALRRPKSEAGMSLALGVWAHLCADRMYNLRFREFCLSRVVPRGEELRKQKQADFNLFGHSLQLSRHVNVTPELLDAAFAFHHYSILPADVRRAVDVADAIVDERDAPSARDYQLIGREWLDATFGSCHERLGVWLRTYVELRDEGADWSAADIRARAGLNPATPDDRTWMTRLP